MIMVDSTHMNDLRPEKVPLACLIHWITQLTFSKCSQMKRLIPRFSGMVSKIPFSSVYLVDGPLTGISSMNGTVT